MTDLQVAAALAGAAASAAAALAAPSVRTALGLDRDQPWRWVVHPRSLDLYADPSRWQRRTDPSGQLMLISCGGALHHARIALAADGVAARITLLPGPDQDHLASIEAAGEIEVTVEAKELYLATGRRDLDRAATPAAPDPAAVAALIRAAEAEGVRMRVLRPDDVRTLAEATSISPSARERIGRDRTATFAVLYGPGTTRADWLRAGQALSAVWLAATRAGVAVVPSSAAVQLPGSREVMRRLIAGEGTPYLALRLGAPAP